MSVLFVFLCLFFALGGLKGGDRVALTASADSGGYTVNKYDVDMTVREDRSVKVVERINITIRSSSATTFYRALPLEGDRYSEIYAKCDGNAEMEWWVADNPDVDGFMDVNCKGGIRSGATWTYEFGYVLEIFGEDLENGMLLDVIGYGWYVPLNDVTVDLHLPSPVVDMTVYSGGYGSKGNAAGVTSELSEDKKTVTLTANRLDVVYNSHYGERMAEGITVRFELKDGAFTPYWITRTFTLEMLVIVLVCGGLLAGVFFLAKLFGKKRELITTVNITAPDGMDPLLMGKILDGNVDSEDVTSMVYYFAEKGYLKIDLSNENDPVLIKTGSIPVDAPSYQRTLFEGLFATANTVSVSELKNVFYKRVETAKSQLVVRDVRRYEKRSKNGFALCVALCALVAFFTLFLFGKIRVGGDYSYLAGAILVLPVLVTAYIGHRKRCYRYKWKKKTATVVTVVQIAIPVVFALIAQFFMAEHLLTGPEFVVLTLCVCVGAMLAPNALSRTERFNDVLGQILGFKDFIVYTEEDKIKFMLEENPSLYYHILPYAQVLGVTDEWEGKFKNILLEPPTWCVGYNDFTLFDYLVLNRCMRVMAFSMLSRPQQSSTVGRSGGGGSFGGFGGGGHGGGGGGLR